MADILRAGFTSYVSDVQQFQERLVRVTLAVTGWWPLMLDDSGLAFWPVRGYNFRVPPRGSNYPSE